MIYSYVNYVRHLYVLFLLQYLFTIFKKQFVVQLYLSSTFETLIPVISPIKTLPMNSWVKSEFVVSLNFTSHKFCDKNIKFC